MWSINFIKMCNDNQLQTVCKRDVIFLKLLFLLQLREVSHAYLKKEFKRDKPLTHYKWVKIYCL